MEQRFKLGEKVWVMSSNRPEQLEITVVRSCQIKGVGKVILYGFGQRDKHSLFSAYNDQDELFSTKEELLASL